MTTLFVVCAAAGGAVLTCQLVLTLIGFGGDWHSGDMELHVDHAGGGDLHTDAGADAHAGTDAHQGQAAGQSHHDAAWLFRAISFRTVVAALTFFGLTGLAAQSAEATTATTILLAAGAGLLAMYGVYWLMQTMYGLRAEGTARIERAVGKRGSVYLPIPGHSGGCGKIQINVQNRTMEYQATTDGETLAAGAAVVVTEVLNTDTVRVIPLCDREAEKARTC